MSDNPESGNSAVVNEAQITLGVLNAVEQNATVTQRSVASDLNIALGMANAYLKRCAKKGFIKIQQVPRNRYAYYLTPKGFAEKSRLTGEYLSISFNFFRAARSQCTELFEQCALAGHHRVALAGVGDLAEIATLCARDHDIEIVGIIEPGDFKGQEFASLKVVRSLDELDDVDVVMITDMKEPQKIFDGLIKIVTLDRLLLPGFLHISRVRPQLMEE
jgi:predicted transcriptional regulator